MSTSLRFATTIVAAALLVGASAASARPTPEQKCQGGKNQTAGRYAACRQNAEAKLATTGDAVKYAAALAKCESKFRTAWLKLEANAAKVGATCLDGAATADAFNTLVGGCTDDVAAGLKGEPLPPAGTLPETNQTTCYDTTTNDPVACAATGQDGELRKGIARSYTDNGDGTITDNVTGLTWEKLADDDSVHDKDAVYTWAEAFGKMTQLNTVPCFAGHCDWRLPNVTELHSIVDYGTSTPFIAAPFVVACAPACTVTDCSCTSAGAHWTSTTYFDDAANAWEVLFDLGYVVIDAKISSNFVRAVRGGA